MSIEYSKKQHTKSNSAVSRSNSCDKTEFSKLSNSQKNVESDNNKRDATRKTLHKNIDENNKETVVFERIVPSAVKKMWVKAEESGSSCNDKNSSEYKFKGTVSPNDKQGKSLSFQYGNALLSHDVVKEDKTKLKISQTTRSDSISEASEISHAKGKWGIDLKHIDDSDKLPFGFPKLKRVTNGTKQRPKSSLIDENFSVTSNLSSKHRSRSVDALDGNVEENNFSEDYPSELSVQQRRKNFFENNCTEKSVVDPPEFDKYAYLHARRGNTKNDGIIDLRSGLSNSKIFYQPHHKGSLDISFDLNKVPVKSSFDVNQHKSQSRSLQELLKYDQEKLEDQVLKSNQNDSNNNQSNKTNVGYITDNDPSGHFNYDQASTISNEFIRHKLQDPSIMQTEEHDKIMTEVLTSESKGPERNKYNLTVESGVPIANFPKHIETSESKPVACLTEGTDFKNDCNRGKANINQSKHVNINPEEELINKQQNNLIENEQNILHDLNNINNTTADMLPNNLMKEEQLKKHEQKQLPSQQHQASIVPEQQKLDRSKHLQKQQVETIPKEKDRNLQQFPPHERNPKQISPPKNTEETKLKYNKLGQVILGNEKSKNVNIKSEISSTSPKGIQRRVGKLIIMTGEQRDKQLKEIEANKNGSGAPRHITINKETSNGSSDKDPSNGFSLTFMSNEVADDDPNEPPPPVPKIIFNNPVIGLQSILLSNDAKKKVKKKKKVRFNEDKMATICSYLHESNYLEERDDSGKYAYVANAVQSERERILSSHKDVREKEEEEDIITSPEMVKPVMEGDHFNSHSQQEGGSAMLF